MMNRRQALRAVTLTSVAALSSRWLAGREASAQPPAPSGAAPAGEPYTLAPLPYPAAALEPHVDAATMEIHHDKHHAAYVRNLNAAVARYPELGVRPVEQLLRELDALPEDIRTTVRNNGGGHANHSLFWNSLSPQGGGEPHGALGEAIQTSFGGFGALQESLAKAAMGVFGSGWAWLSLGRDGALVVEGLPNQDSPLLHGRTPLFGIDVWEHAYYLRYQNRRADYVKALWNVVDWSHVGARYAEHVA